MERCKLKKIRNIAVYTFSVVAIIIVLLAENGCELAYSEGMEHSAYYFYFNSIVFSGAIGFNISIALAVMPYFNKRLEVPRLGKESTLKKSANEFLKAVLSAGIILGLGYLGFILVLLPFFPLNTAEIIDSGFNNNPYVNSIMNGGYAFIAAVFLNAFMSGVMHGSFAYIAYKYGFGYCGILLLPIIIRQLWTSGYIFFNISADYRLDLWLKMKSLYLNELSTLGLSALRVLFVAVLAFLLAYLLQKKR